MSSVPECPICLGPLSNRAVIDPCRHDFDYDCIKSWTNVNSNCPVCRCPVKYIHYSIVSDREYSVEKVKPILAQDVPLPSDDDSDLDNESDYATDMDDDHYGSEGDSDEDIGADSDDNDDHDIFATDGSSDEWEDLSDASAILSEGEYQEADDDGNESVQIIGAVGGNDHDDTFDTVGTVTLDSSDQEHFDDDDGPLTPDYGDDLDYGDGDDPDYGDGDGDESEQEVEDGDVEEDREIYQDIPDSDLDDPDLDETELYRDPEDDEWEDANGYDDDW